MASIEVSEERGVRYLHFGSELVQGAMRIARPDALELEYTRELMLPLLLRRSREWPRSVLQVGLGAASVTRFLHRYFPHARLIVVEIDPRVVATARQFFRLPEESPRLRIAIGDGHEFVDRHEERFDFIVVDGFDERGRTGTMNTTAFYRAVRRALRPGGMASVNLLTRRRSVAASEERMREAFGDDVLMLPPPEAGNTVAVMGLDRPLADPIEELRGAAKALREATGLNLLPTLARLSSRLE